MRTRALPWLAAASFAAAGCHLPPSPADLGPLVPAWTAWSSIGPDVMAELGKTRPVPPKKPVEKRAS